MVSAFEDAGDAIVAARAELGHVCADDRQVIPAWHTLCEDALSAITTKGRRTLRSLSARLRASQVEIRETARDSPVVISDGLLRWTISRTEKFEALGISRTLPTDQAWLALKAVVRDSPVQQASSVEQALADYHALAEKTRTNENEIDARTIGTFQRLCVVVGGPGSGKSFLLSVLAREFAKDSYVSIRIRLRDLATRMKNYGCGVEEGLLQLGVDGTGITQEQLREANFSELVLLCDGLDECGDRQLDIVSGLRDISASHPSYRIVVTTRPIGYTTGELQDWRHYEIAPLAERDTAKNLETLCRCARDGDSTEEADKLLVRIRAYLKEHGVARVLARSPLLLALGAALFLKWGYLGNTKLEVYQRIYRLINEMPARRDIGTKPPAKAIRDNVLNQLDWLICTSPLEPAEELERRCARTIERALGVPYLRAAAEVEGSVKYWEENGLVERLRHSGIDLIAFIHKTCGEFAAARHLSEMETEDAQQAIEKVLSKPDWDEILDFATGTPLASTLAEMLVAEFKAEDPDESTLNRLFRVLVRPEVSLQLGERQSLLERVFALAASEDRQKVYRVGLCLAGHDLSRLPEAEQMALALLVAPAEWSRLVGWTVLVRHFPISVDRRDLEDALVHFMDRSGSRDFFVLQEGKHPFGLLPDRGVFEKFTLGALSLLLPERDTVEQGRLIARVWESQPNATMRFVAEFDAVLKVSGREDASRFPMSPKRPRGTVAVWASSDSDASVGGLFSQILPSAFVTDDTDPRPETGLKYLAAFVEMVGIMNVPVSDMYVWHSDEIQLDQVHALMRSAAYVYDLPTERLAAEAREFIAIVKSLHPDGKTIGLLESLPNVDVAEIDWSRAKQCDIDLDLLEDLVHHQSQWVQCLAAIFIGERLYNADCRSMCERLLRTGTGDALHWAAALTARLPDACDLLVERLRGPHAAGLHHLFDRLTDQGCQITAEHLQVLEKGFVKHGAKTAVSAARWCEAHAASCETWLVDLLRSAGRYWLDNEEPYPKSVGTVPDSPREALLRTLCRIDPPPLEELVEFARDERRDVRNAAIDGIVRSAESSTGEKHRVVESIKVKRFSVRQCEKLVDDNIPYGPDELKLLCNLCWNEDPEYRLFGVRRVLSHPGMERTIALATAEDMKGDNNGNVRDAVHQFLGRETEQGQ